MSSRDSIKVVCRIRPENAIEQGGGYKRCVEHNKFDIAVTVSYPKLYLNHFLPLNSVSLLRKLVI